jgi:hypothetical protein
LELLVIVESRFERGVPEEVLRGGEVRDMETVVPPEVDSGEGVGGLDVLRRTVADVKPEL